LVKRTDLMAARVDSRASATATHGSVTSDLRSSYARETADTVRNQLPWAAPVFLATFGAVAFIELKAHPSRLAPYVEIYALEALAGRPLRRDRSSSPRRSR
jgi:hypothetical protein